MFFVLREAVFHGFEFYTVIDRSGKAWYDSLMSMQKETSEYTAEVVMQEAVATMGDVAQSIKDMRTLAERAGLVEHFNDIQRTFFGRYEEIPDKAISRLGRMIITDKDGDKMKEELADQFMHSIFLIEAVQLITDFLHKIRFYIFPNATSDDINGLWHEILVNLEGCNERLKQYLESLGIYIKDDIKPGMSYQDPVVQNALASGELNRPCGTDISFFLLSAYDRQRHPYVEETIRRVCGTGNAMNRVSEIRHPYTYRIKPDGKIDRLPALINYTLFYFH